LRYNIIYLFHLRLNYKFAGDLNAVQMPIARRNDCGIIGSVTFFALILTR
jgi:hypothetical protein